MWNSVIEAFNRNIRYSSGRNNYYIIGRQRRRQPLLHFLYIAIIQAHYFYPHATLIFFLRGRTPFALDALAPPIVCSKYHYKMPVSTRKRHSSITNVPCDYIHANDIPQTTYGNSNDVHVVTPIVTRSIRTAVQCAKPSTIITIGNDSNEMLDDRKRQKSSTQRSLSFSNQTVDDNDKNHVITKASNDTSKPQTPPTRSKRSKISIINYSSPDTTTELPIVSVTPTNDEKSEIVETPKKTKSIRSKTNVIASPNDWLDTYTLVKELREDRTAPCDHSGCEALPDKSVDNVTYRFQILICLMLSSQTKDAVVGATIRKMQHDNVLNIQSIAQMDSTTLNSYISKVGFHNNKTKYIQQVVQILLDKYNGDIPQTAEEMIKDLPGIGPKMAYIIENVAWDTQSGIGVDTHMHRIFNQIKWVHNTTTPEQTRIQLESWIPKQYWSEINLLWVGFGQEVQQEKVKLFHKAMNCSRPKDALQLIKRCGLDYRKIGKELNMMDEIERVMKEQ